VDEYQLRSSRCADARLDCARRRADPALIEEFETEYRNLSSLYKAATTPSTQTGASRGFRTPLASLGFGDWTLSTTCTASVYDASMELAG